MTLRNAPPKERDGGGYKVICAFGKSEYFFERGWTEGSINRASDLPVGLRPPSGGRRLADPKSANAGSDLLLVINAAEKEGRYRERTNWGIFPV